MDIWISETEVKTVIIEKDCLVEIFKYGTFDRNTIEISEVDAKFNAEVIINDIFIAYKGNALPRIIPFSVLKFTEINKPFSFTLKCSDKKHEIPLLSDGVYNTDIFKFYPLKECKNEEDQMKYVGILRKKIRFWNALKNNYCLPCINKTIKNARIRGVIYKLNSKDKVKITYGKKTFEGILKNEFIFNKEIYVKGEVEVLFIYTSIPYIEDSLFVNRFHDILS